MASGAGSPCGACKFLRRKCEKDCIFAPHFSSEEGAAQFAAIHRVFGASNVSKLLRHVPPPDRGEATVTMAYEAQARLSDPIYGCVGHILALQQQVASLQLELMQAKAQLAHSKIDSQLSSNTWQKYEFGDLLPQPFSHEESISSRSSLDCIDQNLEGSLSMQEMCFPDDPSTQSSTREAHDMGELQALAFSMMGK